MTIETIPADVDTVNLSQIKSKLHPFSITAAGLRELGFEPLGYVQQTDTGSKQNGTFYLRAALPLIKAAALKHFNNLF